MSERPYIEWLPEDHYRAANNFLEFVGKFSQQVEDGTVRMSEKVADAVVNTLMQRAQLHATLACVDPRISELARALNEQKDES